MARQQIDFPIQQAQVATPPNPPAGAMKLYPKTDDRFYQLTPSGVETVIGGVSDPLVVDTLIAKSVKVGNPANIYIRDSGGADRIWMSFGGEQLAWAATGGQFRWVNQNNTVQLMALDTGGGLTVTGGLAVGGGVSVTTLNTSGRIAIAAGDASGIGIAGGSSGVLEVGSNTGGAAKIAFHRHGAYAAYLGIDTDNQWAVGGWSAGAVRYVLLTDNQTQTMSNKTHSGHFYMSGGYIFGSYINLTADVAAGTPAYVAGNNGDNYLRWYPKSVISPPTQKTYVHTLNLTTNQAWNWCTINGAVADAYLNNQSSYFAVKAGATYAIYGTVGGYYNVGLRIFTDGVQRAEFAASHPEYVGGVGGGWCGAVSSSIQFQGRAGVTYNSSVTVNFVPTAAVPN